MSCHLKSHCCKEVPDENYSFNYTWKLGTCSKCKKSSEFDEKDINYVGK